MVQIGWERRGSSATRSTGDRGARLHWMRSRIPGPDMVRRFFSSSRIRSFEGTDRRRLVGWMIEAGLAQSTCIADGVAGQGEGL